MAAIDHTGFDDAAAVEHIELGADEDETQPIPRTGTVINATLRVASRLRGRATLLMLLDERYLRVCERRPRAGRRDYVLDLRFIDPRPVRKRVIAWGWLKTAALTALAFALTPVLPHLLDRVEHSAALMSARILLATTCVLSAMAALYRSCETLDLVSVHGRARFVHLEGGFGFTRAAGDFLRRVADAVMLLREQPVESLSHFLREEMREHYRLREENVLSERDYEASRARILRAHG